MARIPRILLAALLGVAVFPAAANAAILYSTLEAPNDVQGVSSEYAEAATPVAQAFVPASGTARVVSLFGQTLFGSGNGTIGLAIHADDGGKPGLLLTAGQATVGETTSSSPTCMVFSSSQVLNAGTTYWAVFRGINKGAAWLFHRQQERTVLASANAGATWGPSGGAQKTFGIRIEDVPQCGPKIQPNPVKGAEVADMYTKPGGTSFNTIFIGNSGNQDLKLTGASFSGQDAASFRLSSGEPGGPADQPFTWPHTVAASAQAGAILYVVCTGAQPEGQRHATLTLTSNDPAEPSISWPVRCVVDATPPTIAYTLAAPSGRASWYVVKPVGLGVQTSDPESGGRVKRIFCSDSGGPDLEAFSSSTTFGLNAEGVHNVSCRATDVANNTSAAGAYVAQAKIDTIGPIASKGSGPAALVTSHDAAFGFTGSDATSGVHEVECRLDSSPYTACASPASRTAIPDGLHQFDVRLRDVAGNYGTPATWNWRVDTTPPDTALSGGPAAVTKASTASFTVTGSDPGGSGVAKVECSLDDAAFANCPAPAEYAGFAEGHHTLRARAKDVAGHLDASPAEHVWDIDLTAPTALLTEKPAAKTGARTATFAFTATDAGPAANAGFDCRLDDAAFAPCTSPVVLENLEALRDHTFEVRAFDSLENVQAAPTAYTWTITNDPFALADSATTVAGVAVDIDVLANDGDPKGGTVVISAFDAKSAQGGTVTQAGGVLRYSPAIGFVGIDTFTYRVKDAGGTDSETATVTIEVKPPPAVRQPLIPVTPIGGLPAGDKIAPVVSKLKVRSRKASFRLSEAAKVKVVVEQYRKGRKKPVKRWTKKLVGRLATNTLTLSKKLKAGRYRLVITAIDAAGNAAKVKRLKFKLKR